MKIGPPRRPRSRTLDDALLPLVNVVFLLMIFFLSVGRFGGPPPLDKALQSQAAEQQARVASRVLELRAGAQMGLDQTSFPDAELPGRALAWQGSALDLRVPGDVPAERVLRVLAVLRAAGVTDVRLLTQRAAP